MVKRRKDILPRSKKSRSAIVHHSQNVAFLLERGTLQEMKDAKEQMTALLRYHWEYYSELALQRSQIQEELKKALIRPCLTNYKFNRWQRAVKWKYGLHPLSTTGSVTRIGQRFNTGGDVNFEVPSFSALYLALDKDTALQETLGQVNGSNKFLSAQELALTNPQSEVIVSISGELEKVFDLTDAKNLKEFVKLTQKFKLSDGLRKKAKELGEISPDIVQGHKDLHESILMKNWRVAPAQYDVPLNSQIFGHLIFQAGVEGILYPSKFTGKECLALFPRNFAATSSFLAFDDEAPHDSLPKRIDSTNWRLTELPPAELFNRSK